MSIKFETNFNAYRTFYPSLVQYKDTRYRSWLSTASKWESLLRANERHQSEPTSATNPNQRAPPVSARCASLNQERQAEPEAPPVRASHNSSLIPLHTQSIAPLPWIMPVLFVLPGGLPQMLLLVFTSCLQLCTDTPETLICCFYAISMRECPVA